MGRIYYRALPHLGFNRNITKAFHTLSTQYQGIGLKKWSIEKLATDITTLIRHWRTDSTLGQSFEMVYESFQMEVGLDGNILTRSYKQLQELASHSWFKVLWQYMPHSTKSASNSTKFSSFHRPAEATPH
jgi:hypothetical protein